MTKENEKSKIFSVKRSRLFVSLPDGTLLQGKNGIETFLLFINEMGWEKIRDLNFTAKGNNLIIDHNSSLKN